jgi:hypothetical protein
MMKLSPYTGASAAASDKNHAPPGRTISRLKAGSPCQVLAACTHTSLLCCFCCERCLHEAVLSVEDDLINNVCMLSATNRTAMRPDVSELETAELVEKKNEPYTP